jgi:hypothetical protein
MRTWERFAALRNCVEREPDALPPIRAVFGPLESELWFEADAVAGRCDKHRAFVEGAWERVKDALGQVEVSAASLIE